MKGGEKNDLFWPAGAGRLVTNLMRGTDKSGFSDSLNLTLPNKTKLERRERGGEMLCILKRKTDQNLDQHNVSAAATRGGRCVGVEYFESVQIILLADCKNSSLPVIICRLFQCLCSQLSLC